MASTAPTVAKYLLELPADRRPAIEAVRRVILANIDKDIEETLTYGSIGYVVPHRVFPGGYHCDPKQPVPYINLASQKHHMALYLMFAYTGGFEEDWIRRKYAEKGKRLDMGKSCLRFRSLEELDLAILAEAIRRVPAQQHIATYVASVGADKWKQAPARPAGPPVVFTPVPPGAPAVAARTTGKKATKRSAKKTAKKIARKAVKKGVKKTTKKTAKKVAKKPVKKPARAKGAKSRSKRPARRPRRA